MPVVLAEECLEPPLPDRPAGAVLAPIPPHMLRQEPLHPARQVAVAVRPQDQVEMIGHQAIAKDPNRESALGQGDHLGERREVVKLEEDVGAGVTAVQNIVILVGD